jgi:5'-nucleotidase
MKRTNPAVASLLLAALATLSSCSSFPSLFQKDEEIPQVEQTGNLETIVVLGTNDIHGALAPERMKTKDPTPVEYEKGGAAQFASQVRLLRKQYGEHLLFLDAGDEFQGSIDSNLDEGRPMVRFFNELGLNAAVIGNHEFDFGPEGTRGAYDPKALGGKDLRGTLKARILEARYPYLAANVHDKATGMFPGVPGTKRSVLLTAGRLKVGVIGLTTLDAPVTTRPEYVKDLEFRQMENVALEESKSLREQGAQIVLLLAHAGVFCDIPVADDRPQKPGLIRTESDFQTGCESKHEIPELLRRLPRGTIDAVVSGHTHSLVHHWIEGVPVIQAGTRNAYFNLVYLTWDWERKRLRGDKTRIEGPIPICPKVFANQRNCNGDAPPPPNGRGPLVPQRFRGQEIKPDEAMLAALAPTFAATEAKKEEVVGRAARTIPHIKTEESPLGDVVADALRSSLGTDVAIMNVGGIRADWEAGPIRYADVFRSIPFDNFVSKLTLTGRELRRFIRIAHAGARGFFSTSGLRVKAIRRDDEPYTNDLDGNGKVEPWEHDRVLEAKLADGSEIDDAKTYTVATIDFLLSGGDSMGWFMNQIPADRKVSIAGPVLRDAVVEYVRAESAGHPEGLNPESRPVVDPARPRLELVPRPVKKEKRQSSGGKRRRRR